MQTVQNQGEEIRLKKKKQRVEKYIEKPNIKKNKETLQALENPRENHYKKSLKGIT